MRGRGRARVLSSAALSAAHALNAKFVGRGSFRTRLTLGVSLPALMAGRDRFRADLTSPWNPDARMKGGGKLRARASMVFNLEGQMEGRGNLAASLDIDEAPRSEIQVLSAAFYTTTPVFDSGSYTATFANVALGDEAEDRWILLAPVLSGLGSHTITALTVNSNAATKIAAPSPDILTSFWLVKLPAGTSATVTFGGSDVGTDSANAGLGVWVLRNVLDTGNPLDAVADVATTSPAGTNTDITYSVDTAKGGAVFVAFRGSVGSGGSFAIAEDAMVEDYELNPGSMFSGGAHAVGMIGGEFEATFSFTTVQIRQGIMLSLSPTPLEPGSEEESELTSESESESESEGEPLVPVFLGGRAESTSNNTNHTFALVGLGEEDPGRYIVVALSAVSNASAGQISSCTINGVSATVINAPSKTTEWCAIAYAHVPEGETGNITIQTNANFATAAYLAVFRFVVDPALVFEHLDIGSVGGQTLSDTLDTQPGAPVVIAAKVMSGTTIESIAAADKSTPDYTADSGRFAALYAIADGETESVAATASTQQMRAVAVSFHAYEPETETEPPLSTLAFLEGRSETTGSSSNHTFSNVSFGAADDERWIIVVLGAQSNASANAITGCTIGGVAATVVNTQAGTTAWLAIAFAKVPSGNSGNIVFTTNALFASRAFAAVYRFIGEPGKALSVLDFGRSTATDPFSDTIATVPGLPFIAGVLTTAGTSVTAFNVAGVTVPDYANTQSGQFRAIGMSADAAIESYSVDCSNAGFRSIAVGFQLS